jgi:hypothetical protein
VHVGIRFVLELASKEPAMRGGELDRLLHHSGSAGRPRRQYHLRPQKAHESAALDTEGFRHGYDQGIPFLCAHHREPDPGVAAGGLDHGLAGSELTTALSVFDHAKGQPVLYRTEGIEGLNLHVQLGIRRREPVDAHYGGAPDSLEDVGVARHCLCSSGRISTR